MKRLWQFITFLFIVGCTTDTTNISGTVDDVETGIVLSGRVMNKQGEGVAGVIARLNKIGFADTTDAKGNYIIAASKDTLKKLGIVLSNIKDTVQYLRDNSTFATQEVKKWVDTLPDVYIIQRNIGGKLNTTQTSFKKIEAILTDLDDSTIAPKHIPLWYFSTTFTYSGFAYFVNQAGRYSVYVRVFDPDSHVTGRSADVIFTIIAGDIDIPTFSPTNAIPIPFAGKDTVVSVNDTIRLHAAAVDSFGGTIKIWEWSIKGTPFVKTSTSDTTITSPVAEDTNYQCVLKVTDDDGNMARDTVKIKVLQDVPQIVFITKDTIIEHGGSVCCSISVQQQYGTMVVEIDSANNGNFISLGSVGLAGSKAYSFITGNACSWDSVKIRITDDDGNVVSRGFKADIRPQPLTINTIDSTVNTITVNYNQSQETDFKEYRIYRDTTNIVDTNSQLWATVPSAGTISYSTITPSYAWAPRYYRIYQKDNEGLWSAGSNVVYGNIVNSPPTKPEITFPQSDGDSVWSNTVLRWTKCSDANNNPVKYRILINYNNSSYVQFATELSDTFKQLQGYDSLGIRFKVIAYGGEGDSSVWSDERQATIRDAMGDIDGNVYKVVKIGNQLWTVENLRATKYNNGTAIPLVTVNAAWNALTTPGYCYYNNTTNTDSIKKFGALYNWYIVNPSNPKKIAPVGWHVPTDAEWTILENYMIATGYNWDGTTTDNKIAKSLASNTDWVTYSTPGTIGCDLTTNNRSGFSALPGGCRYGGGSFYGQSEYGSWWSTTVSGATGAYGRYLYYVGDYLYRVGNLEGCGFSVRLLRDIDY
jgi:uncharacterized protein (TIGR02145 family)